MDPGALRAPWADTRQITNYHTSLSRPYQHPTRLYVGTAERKKKRLPRRESRNEKRDNHRSEEKKRRPRKKTWTCCMDMMHGECVGLRNSAGDNSRRMRRATTHTQKDKTQQVDGIKDARPIAGHHNVMMFIMAWESADYRQSWKREFHTE